jgi:protoporphyrinogen oxidase
MNKETPIIAADVIVLGAGLSGLAAADGVLKHGEKPIVIEKEEIVGGQSASIRRNGYIFDFGGHRFLPHVKETADYVQGLFGDGGLLLRKRKSQIYLNKKFLMYPPEAMNILKNLGVLTSLDCAAQGLYARLRQAILRKQEVSLEDWLVNRFGRKLYDIYFGPYSAKLWGVEPSHICSEWAPQRVSVSSIGIMMQKLIATGRKSIKTYADQFLYPVGGIGRIPENMAKRIAGVGGSVLTGLNVLKVTHQANGFLVEAEDVYGRKKIFSAPRLISSIPLPEFIRILSPTPPKEILEAAGQLRFRSVRFLNLMLDIPEVTKNTWLYIPEDRYIFFRIQEFTRWCPQNAPKGKTSFALELACEKGDDVWTMSDDELLHACLRDLKKMGLDLKNKVTGHFSTYAEHAYPFYAIGYRRHLHKIYRFMETLEDVVLCGRQGMFRYINMDRAIEIGFEATAALYDAQKRSRFLKDKEGKEYLEGNLCLTKKR